MSRMIARTCAALLAILPLAACSEDLITAPSPSDPVTFTETFSGTVARSGGQTHPFLTQASGTVTATITALGPDNTIKVGFALGTWNGSSCQLVIVKDDAGASTAIIGAVSAVGSLCVRIYDVGQITTPAEYEIQVVHP